MGGGGVRLGGADLSSEGASLSRIWEVRKVHIKCTVYVVGHKSKIR